MKTIHRIVRVAGCAIFALAFFLPAVEQAVPKTGRGTDLMTGWICAWWAFLPTIILVSQPGARAFTNDRLIEITLLLSGWVNPLLLIYLFLSFWTRFIWARRALSAAILLCVVSTWIFLARSEFRPQIGHVLWIAGIFAILAPEVFQSVSTGPAPDGDAPSAS